MHACGSVEPFITGRLAPAAMKGHVLAKGDLVGKYGQKQKPQK
jgi:hypothetical protein